MIFHTKTDLNFDLKPTASGQPKQNVQANQPRRNSNVRYQSPYFNNSTATSSNDNRSNKNSNQRQNFTNNEHTQSDQSPFQALFTTSNVSSTVEAELQGPGHFSSSTSTSSACHVQTPTEPTFQTQTSTDNDESNVHKPEYNEPSAPHESPPKNSGDSVASKSNSSTTQRNKSDDSYNVDKTRSDNSDRKLRDNKGNVKKVISACSDNLGCECSDEEIFTKFKRNYKCELLKNAIDTNDGTSEDQKAGPSVSLNSGRDTSIPNTPAKDEVSFVGSSDVSSFEDLGAVSVNNASKRASSASCDTDNWQIVNKPGTETSLNVLAFSTLPTTSSANPQRLTTTQLPNTVIEPNNQRISQISEPTFQTHSANEIDRLTDLDNTPRKKNSCRKLLRRRSDGIVYMAGSSSTVRHLYDYDPNHADDDDDEDADDDENHDGTIRQDVLRRRTKKSCHKCGKRKGDLKKHIARFRHELETTTNSTESEIKQQLDAFLRFLETHTKSSFEVSDDTESENDAEVSNLTQPDQSECNTYQSEIVITAPDDDDDFDDDAGINVYGISDENLSSQSPRRFFDLNGIETRYIH